MRNLLLFGASSPSGEALRTQAGSLPLKVAGRRRPPGCPQEQFLPCDLSDPQATLGAVADQAVLVSFAPIWELAPFLARQAQERPAALAGLEGVIACSSSSVITKRFAVNAFDRRLVQQLTEAQRSLEQTCRLLGVPLRILAPTLIYGQVGPFRDRNLSVLANLMRRTPVLPLPAHTGLRQPIHASQLAAVALHLAQRLSPLPPAAVPGEASDVLLALGGDDCLSYREMLQRLRASLPAGDPGRNCRLLTVPTHLMHVLAAPLLPVKPKLFEAVLRIGADLAGFTPTHRILEAAPQPFPLGPLAL
ncbi:hypothetical protein NZK32_04150 [Cyanobium sp. FGCU-52]|nr:hypothetical protein [Cyanobium sp. FGCU52]